MLAAALALGLAVPAAAEGASPVATDCEAYIVTERGTGQVLIEKNADEVLYPASITKIMILGLACEKAQGNWDTMLTVTEDEMNAMENGAAHIALRQARKCGWRICCTPPAFLRPAMPPICWPPMWAAALRAVCRP